MGQQLTELKKQLATAEATPNKTPEDKEKIEKLKAAISKQQSRMKKSESHWRRGKGNR